MSAEILIESSQHGRSTYWIDKQVVRMGGNSACEVYLPGIPENALTVQFREGDYVVWNRLPTAVKLGRRTIAANTVGKWTAKKMLSVGPYQLTLRIEGDSQPAPKSHLAKKKTLGEAADAGAPAQSLNTHLVNILAVIAIVLIGVFVLNNNRKAQVASLTPIVETLIKGSAQGDLFADKIRNSLQKGRDAETRKNTQAAIRYYIEAREQTRQSRLHDDLKLQLVNYLNQRLQILNW